MIKKIIGIIFIIAGALLGMSAISNFPRIRELISETTQETSKYESGFLYGYITVCIITIIASFLLIKYGIQWVRKKTPKK